MSRTPSSFRTSAAPAPRARSFPRATAIGLQIVGRLFDEATVLRTGRAYEAAVGGSFPVPTP